MERVNQIFFAFTHVIILFLACLLIKNIYFPRWSCSVLSNTSTAMYKDHLDILYIMSSLMSLLTFGLACCGLAGLAAADFELTAGVPRSWLVAPVLLALVPALAWGRFRVRLHRQEAGPFGRCRFYAATIEIFLQI